MKVSILKLLSPRAFFYVLKFIEVFLMSFVYSSYPKNLQTLFSTYLFSNPPQIRHIGKTYIFKTTSAVNFFNKHK